MAKIMDLPRPVMRDVGRELVKGLVARRDAGPAEPGLDAFIPEVEEVVVRLETHVGGGALADAGRRAAVARQELADGDVDTWLRHHESFFSVEASRRVGPHAAAAGAIHGAAFRDGLGIVDDYIPDENRACRTAISVLRAPEHAATLEALRFPMAWLDAWEGALDESDAAFRDAERSRLDRSTHVGHGRDAEVDFADTALRLRRYIDSRASRDDKARIAEGKRLLAPLLSALKKIKTERLARATRRENAGQEAPPSQPAPTEG
jgi:hypothetical protein